MLVRSERKQLHALVEQEAWLNSKAHWVDSIPIDFRATCKNNFDSNDIHSAREPVWW